MINNPKIIILLKSISRYSGGMSSALDLTETLFQMGFDVNVIVMNYGPVIKNWLYDKIRLKKNYLSKIPLKNIYPFPYSDKLSRSKLNYIPVNKLRKKEKNFGKLMSNADIVLHACLLPQKVYNQLKKTSNAKFIYNHAGSPDTYEKYWIKEKHISSKKPNEDKYKLFCQRYDGILFQASDQRDECVKRGAMKSNECVVLPPSCSENAVLSAKQTFSPYASDRKSIAYIGSIQPRKAQHLAIESFSKIANSFSKTDLHFIGGGIDSQYGIELKEISRELDLHNRVYFHGHRYDYLRFMSHANIIIQSSKAEGVSRILREAMLLKKPIVSFAISGTSSILNNEKDALLVEPENTEAMSFAIKKLLRDKKLEKKLTRNAYKKYLLKHSNAVYSNNLIDMINYFSAL